MSAATPPAGNACGGRFFAGSAESAQYFDDFLTLHVYG